MSLTKSKRLRIEALKAANAAHAQITPKPARTADQDAPHGPATTSIYMDPSPPPTGAPRDPATPHPPSALPPSALPIRIGPGPTLILSGWNDRDITIPPTQEGLETLLKLLELERRRTAGEPLRATPLPRPMTITINGTEVRRFTTSGRPERQSCTVTLSDLGL